MAIRMQGAWTLQVQSRDENEGYRFIVTGADIGSGVHDGAPGKMIFVLFEIDDTNGVKTTSGTLADSQTESTGSAGYGKATVNPVGADKVSSTVRYVAEAFTLGKVNAGTVHAFCGATVNWARETNS